MMLDGPARTPVQQIFAGLVLALAAALTSTGCSGSRLAVDYAILLERPGATQLVSDRAVFQTGDLFKLQIVPGQDSVMYLFNQNTDGTLAVLFPNPRMGMGFTALPAGDPVFVPPIGPRYQGFALTPPAGTERLLLCLSPRPVPELDRIVAEANLGARLSLQDVQRTIGDVQTYSVYDGVIRVEPSPTFTYVRLKSPNPTAVLIHEITIRHRPGGGP